MKGTELLEKMELIDPAYVEAADKNPGHKKHRFLKWGTAAACVALMIMVGSRFLPPQEMPRDPNLPMLTVTDDTLAMGFEGYCAYDISELVNDNPWSEDDTFATLPVYRNVMDDTTDDMKQTYLLEIAERLGLETDALTITNDVSDKEALRKIEEKYASIGEPVPDSVYKPHFWYINTDDIRIRVDSTMMAYIEFDPAIALPEQYSFTHWASCHDTLAAAEYLREEYRDLIAMVDPQIDISGGDYDIYNRQAHSVSFFENSEDKLEQILNYNFNRIWFCCDDNGALFLVKAYRFNLTDKVGDYPIITAEQAKKLLLDGDYLTSVPYEIEGADCIKKVELYYRTAGSNEYYMPYYKFYVEIPALEREDGMKTYGAYHVPAVEETYFADMSVRDGNLLG